MSEFGAPSHSARVRFSHRYPSDPNPHYPNRSLPICSYRLANRSAGCGGHFGIIYRSRGVGGNLYRFQIFVPTLGFRDLPPNPDFDFVLPFPSPFDSLGYYIGDRVIAYLIDQNFSSLH